MLSLADTAGLSLSGQLIVVGSGTLQQVITVEPTTSVVVMTFSADTSLMTGDCLFFSLLKCTFFLLESISCEWQQIYLGFQRMPMAELCFRSFFVCHYGSR